MNKTNYKRYWIVATYVLGLCVACAEQGLEYEDVELVQFGESHSTIGFVGDTNIPEPILCRPTGDCGVGGPFANPIPRCAEGEVVVYEDNCFSGQCVLPEMCSDVASGCDYSNADQNNGWGWDASTGESCAPLYGGIPPRETEENEEQDDTDNANENVGPIVCLRPDSGNCRIGPINNPYPWNCPIGQVEVYEANCSNRQCVDIEMCSDIPSGCDYSDSDQNNGWGWNASTNESCPPL